MTLTPLALAHYLSILLLLALLLAELLQFRRLLSMRRARWLIATDLAYGGSAGLVLATGLARVIWQGKGWEYYLHNGFFHAKIGLFLVVSCLSILPTLCFLGWRERLRQGLAPQIEARQAWRIRAVLLSELLLLLAMAPLATLMARGHGQF